MLTLELLKQFGADVEDGLSRCINDEGFYMELIDMTLDDESFGALSDAIRADDRQAAFRAAHGLKGITANVSLTPLYKELSELTELLRANKDADYPAYLDRILQMRDTLLAARNG